MSLVPRLRLSADRRRQTLSRANVSELTIYLQKRCQDTHVRNLPHDATHRQDVMPAHMVTLSVLSFARHELCYPRSRTVVAAPSQRDPIISPRAARRD
jgi:hypothetical protein